MNASLRPSPTALSLGIVVLLCGACTQQVPGDATLTDPFLESARRAGYAPLDPAAERRRGWSTAFEQRSIDLGEVYSAGLVLDAIPAVSEPRFVPATQALEQAGDPRLPVVVVGERAYPIAWLRRYEVVNDTQDELFLAVSYCTLCDSPLAFERRLGDVELELGVSGFLRRGNSLLFDRESMSLWQQLTGEALVGMHTGRRLPRIACSVVSLASFGESVPAGLVWAPSEAPFVARVRNPGPGYDAHDAKPELFFAEPDDRLAPMQRTLALDCPGGCRALLARADSAPILKADRVLLGASTSSAFGSDGPTTYLNAFSRRAGRALLRFERLPGSPERYRDLETDSRWSALGVALEGPLVGERLGPVVATRGFWHALAAHAQVLSVE